MEEGDALTPLREAARNVGVNVHTGRHAYTALARKGLVDAGYGGRKWRAGCPGLGWMRIRGRSSRALLKRSAATTSSGWVSWWI
ncbi:MAG: hypothetical protein IH989_03135 [Planctomycetes bacterium]|nr:hypothetical protein [Planctomycetota bacterium]